MKELYLERRGCEFWKKDLQVIAESDVGNYRVCTPGETIKLKDGRKMFFEFGTVDRYAYRKTNKRTGKPLKHPVKELVMTTAMTMGTQYENADGCWRDSVMEHDFYSTPRKYTEQNILDYINSVSVDHYDKIVYIDSFSVVQERKTNFVPSWKMIDYAKTHNIEWWNEYGETVLKLYTGIYKYHHYKIVPHDNDESETLIIYLERVRGAEEA